MWTWLRQLRGRNGKDRRDPLEGWDGIHREATPGDRPINREPGAPPADYSREDAAYRRQQARLARDHLGKIALIHNDDVAGIYDDLDEAILDGYKRFGDVQLMFPLITDPNDPPEWVSFVDPNDPGFERNDRKGQWINMGKYTTAVSDRLVLAAQVFLTPVSNIRRSLRKSRNSVV